MRSNRQFWNREYNTGEHLALSTEPSEDLEKFLRFLERREGKLHLNPHALAVDFGCGNGRNLVLLAQQYGMRCVGYDISEVAIKQARELSEDLPIKYETRSIEGAFSVLKDASATLALDMMSSHFLRQNERGQLRDEISRILMPGGWLFYKSFLGEEDLNAERMLDDYPADEPNAYIHPSLGVYEHVWPDIRTLEESFAPQFEAIKIEKSHRHLDRHGNPNKRRTVSAYLRRF